MPNCCRSGEIVKHEARNRVRAFKRMPQIILSPATLTYVYEMDLMGIISTLVVTELATILIGLILITVMTTKLFRSMLLLKL